MDQIQIISFIITFFSLSIAYYFFNQAKTTKEEKEEKPKFTHISSTALKHEPKEGGKKTIKIYQKKVFHVLVD